MNTETMMTLAQVAKKLGISKQAVYISIHSKRLFAQKFGDQWFVTPEQLDDHIKYKHSRVLTRRDDGELLYDPKKGQYSIAQIAQMFGVKKARVYHLVRHGALKHSRYRAAYIVEINDLDEARKIVVEE